MGGKQLMPLWLNNIFSEALMHIDKQDANAKWLQPLPCAPIMDNALEIDIVDDISEF